MMFLAVMMVNIPVLEGKSFIMHCACPNMESIIIIEIFLYGNKCTIDLVLSLGVLMFRSVVGSCSPADYVCSVDGTRSASIFLN